MYKAVLVVLVLSFVVYSAQSVKDDFTQIRAQNSSQIEKTIDNCR